jgi:hypothetical protein
VVIPELCKIRDELNRWLTPKYGEKLCIDFDFSVIPELQEETDKVVSQMTQAWWLTPNEKRMAMNYGEDEENDIMNEYFIPANLMPTNDFDEVVDEPLDIDVNEILNEPEQVEENKKHIIDMETEKDLFKTKELAEERAVQLGGNGSHEIAGYFMPFNTHKEYVDAKNKR